MTFDNATVQRKWDALPVASAADRERALRAIAELTPRGLVDPIVASGPWEALEMHRRFLAAINEANRKFYGA